MSREALRRSCQRFTDDDDDDDDDENDDDEQPKARQNKI